MGHPETLTSMSEFSDNGQGRQVGQRFGRAAAFDVRIIRDVAIPLGADRLAADVYLPVDAPPGPALVTLLPYHKDGGAGVMHWAANHYFAARGYACVLVDLLGTGASSGRTRPAFDAGEGDDGVAAVEWAAAQAWCDGAVGMWGASYGAITSLRTAARGPGSLQAIAPMMGMVTPGSGFVHPDGVRGAMGSLGVWALGTLLGQLLPPLNFDADGDWERLWHDRLHHAEPYLLDMFRHGPADPVWNDRTIAAETITVPTFCIAGWRDLFCAETLDAYARIPAPKKLLVGPWMHTSPDVSPFEPLDYLALLCDWWDRWLLGRDGGAGGALDVAVHIDGAQRWTSLAAWPPPAECQELKAGADGRLVADEPAAGGTVTCPVDPTVGLGSGLWGLPTGGLGMPADAHDDDCRSAAFTGDPLAAPIVIAGRPTATVVVPGSADRARTVVVKLNDVDEQGRSSLITVGSTSLPAGADGGREAVVELELAPICYEVAAGHRLRLVVAGADFPRLWPDPVAGLVGVVCRDATDGSPVTAVSIPVLQGGEREFDAPAPDLEGYAAPPVIDGSPTWNVEFDHATDTLALEFGGRMASRTPQGEHLLETEQVVRASVSRARPDLARITGTADALVRQGAGGDIAVRAQIVVTSNTATATGEVRVDGVPTFSGRWSTDTRGDSRPASPVPRERFRPR